LRSGMSRMSTSSEINDHSPGSVYCDHTASNPFMTLRTSGRENVSRADVEARRTYIRLSVTFTLLVCKPISFDATCSDLAFHISRTTRVSNTGSRNVSQRNAFTSCAVTMGGRRCKVSTALRRGLCRLIRSNAGRRRLDDVLDWR